MLVKVLGGTIPEIKYMGFRVDIRRIGSSLPYILFHKY